MQYYNICDIIVTKTTITYANGAKVNTSFITNMYGDNRIVLDGILTEKINMSQNKKKLVKKNNNPFILSGGRLQKWVSDGKVITIKKEDTLPIISSKYKVFGNGCYIREGVLTRINSDSSTLTDEECLYLHHNNFKPIC